MHSHYIEHLLIFCIYFRNSAYGCTLKNLQKYSSIKYSDNKYDAANMINDSRFRNLEEIDTDFFEMNFGRKHIKMNLPTYIGHHILCLAKKTMLSFFYDYMCIFFKVKHLELIQMDTDSLYFCHTYKTIDELVRDDMKSTYDKLVYGSCFKKKICKDGEEKMVPDLDIEVKPALDHLDNDDPSLKGKVIFGDYYLCRGCCSDHFKLVDSRTIGQFKLEMEISASDGVMLCLNSKTYVAHSDLMNFTKLSSKGLSSRFLSDPVSIFKSVLEDQKSRGGVQKGFLFKSNKMRTYDLFRTSFSFFYIKRLVLPNSYQTKCLPITLKPYKRSDEVKELKFPKN